MLPPRRRPSPTARSLQKAESRWEGVQLPGGIPTETLLEATISVPWERPVHVARLDFLRRVARPGERSVHVACGIDRLGFIDVACGLTTILTDNDAASLDILSVQFRELESRLGPFTGRLECRQMAIEALAAAAGFPPASVQHLTLQNLFNAHLHHASEYPHLLAPLLSVVAPGGSFFLTVSEASVLARLAQARQIQLMRVGEIQGYYDENVVLLQVLRPAG
jgi:hypothetical protein